MANTRSTQMANLLATPRVQNAVHEWRGRQRMTRATIVVAAADADGRIYVAARFNASDRIWSIRCQNSAITAGTVYHCGLYVAGDWTAADQTAVDADILFDTVDMSSARAVVTELLGTGTNAFDPGLYGAPLWQVAGVATEPIRGTQYDVCLTAATVGSAAGTIELAIEHTSGE